MASIAPRFSPPLEKSFLPAALWNRAYKKFVADDAASRPFVLALVQADGSVSRHDSRILAATHSQATLNFEYAERLLKFLLWQKGGCRVLVGGAPELARQLKQVYSPTGARAFDYTFMGEKVYGKPFEIVPVPSIEEIPSARSAGMPMGRHLEGCRIGFDLGGSDRKAAAIIDGKVVFSEEIAWDPYFQKDPAYHIEGVHDSLLRAAAHLPRVDAIGGSAAGVYVNNEVRVASLFRGVPQDAFDKHIRRMFFTLQERWGGVPFEVVNDGEVTALAGSMSLGANSVLGVSMGTSMAGGYVQPDGSITPWLNELAFAPIDYRADAPRDEWSGDIGCGVQYFSQQGVARFAKNAGFNFPETMPLAERLVEVQKAMSAGDARAVAVYDTVGICFGYAAGQYADFYDVREMLVLGRVTSGAGGERILERAREVLRGEFPEYADRIRLSMPNEKDKRHGQAVAAASLPALKNVSV